MLGLAYVFMALAPTEILSFSIGESWFMDAWAACGVFALFGMLLFVADLWPVPWPAVTVLWPFALFLALGTLSIFASPYFHASYYRGLREALGTAGMMMTAVSFAALVSGSLATLQRLVRCATIVGGTLGAVAVAQFVVNNLGFGPVLNFRFVTDLTNGAYDQLARTAGLWRPASFTSEPAHLGTFLGACSGFALVRLGLLGRPLAARLAPAVPRWTAFAVLGGMAVSLALVTYLVLAVGVLTTLALGMAAQARERRRRAPWRIVGAAIVVALLTAPVVAAGALSQKIDSLAIISEVLQGENIGGQTAESFDGVILAINTLVTARNLLDRPAFGIGLGAYPLAYDAVSPDFAFNSAYFSRINRNGEISLLLRLLSETGLCGTAAFFLGCFGVLRVGWITARRTRQFAATEARAATLHAIAVASTGSCVAVMFGYLGRYGAYYGATFWEALAFNLALATFAPFARRPFARGGRVSADDAHPALAGE